MGRYIISLDQSTQGTKALLLNQKGEILGRADKAHKQYVNEKGWVSHDLDEIYSNSIEVVKEVINRAGIDKDEVVSLGMCNQRETSCLWNKKTGRPIDKAVVWQCSRAADICERQDVKCNGDLVFERTGMPLSPYFPAAKIKWLLENNKNELRNLLEEDIGIGTIDSYLLSRLTNGEAYKTDMSNASRTQLFNLKKLEWDREICDVFGIPLTILPEVCDSNNVFGETDCDGFFEKKVPIVAVLGDSHAALFGQRCLRPGMVKATYGTGSSIMMNIGEEVVLSNAGLMTSVAWSIDGKTEYVLEGNLNYTGAVVTWLKDDLKLIDNPGQTEEMSITASKEDRLYLVPAFSGLGSPYWNSEARAAIVGMDRTTGRNEIVRAAIECIAYQINDIITAMENDSGQKPTELRVDGGATKNKYLMQFQSDILNVNVAVPETEELSCLGVAYLAGLKMGLFDEGVLDDMERKIYKPTMDETKRKCKIDGWKNAVSKVND